MGLPEPAGRTLETTSQGLGFSHGDICRTASVITHAECVWIVCVCERGSRAASPCDAIDERKSVRVRALAFVKMSIGHMR